MEESLKKAGRIVLYDNLKGILILLVVIGHIVEPYVEKSHILKALWIFIYSFHMPLFLFISGLLHKQYKSDDKLNRNRIYAMLICGYMMKVLIGLVQILFSGRETMPFRLLSESGVPWFLFVLATYELLVYFLRGINPAVILTGAVLLSIFVGYDNSVGDYLVLSRTIVFFPFYLFGYFLKPERVLSLTRRVKIKIFSLAIVVLYVGVCFIKTSWIYNYRTLFTGRNSFKVVAEKLPTVSFCSRIFTMLIAIVIGFAIIALVSNKKLSILSYMGSKTLQIYFWHRPIVYILVDIQLYEMLCAYCGEILGIALLIFLAIALSIVLMSPLFEHPTKEIFEVKRALVSPQPVKIQEKESCRRKPYEIKSAPVLELYNISIRYITGDFKDIGLKEYVMRKLKGDYHICEFWADKDVSFSLEKGDMLGIIGTNGAGKSTLLKAIAGIMEPTKGYVKREGTIAALLELGSGFDKELTVRENAYLRGAMLGYTREFMDETYEQIIDFAELWDFQDRPFKQLSSGMKSRLAFSIASLVRPDILILDEVLSVGDGAFRKKSETKMKEIINSGATTIIVSHSLEQVRAMCNKVLWLHKGEQVEFGEDVQGICDRYQEFLAEFSTKKNKRESK